MVAFFVAVDELARSMNLEVEFTTQSSGGWMPEDRPVIEFVATDTHDTDVFEGGKIFGARA